MPARSSSLFMHTTNCVLYRCQMHAIRTANEWSAIRTNSSSAPQTSSFYLLYSFNQLTILQPDKLIENWFPFTIMAWPRGQIQHTTQKKARIGQPGSQCEGLRIVPSIVESKEARKVSICQDRGVDLVSPTLACVFDVVLFAAVSVAPLDSRLTSNLSNRLFTLCYFRQKKHTQSQTESPISQSVSDEISLLYILSDAP